MAILDIFYPRKCKLCGKTLKNNEFILCDCCLKTNDYYYYKPINLDGIDGVDSPLIYRDFVREAMHKYKFNGKKSYADWFARLTGDCIESHIDLWKPDIITYVPISFLRFMKRGYNQSEIVAKLISKRFNIPCMPLLKKRPFVRMQSSVEHDKRAENVRNAFYMVKHTDICGKSILLIDDVITTGSTVCACKDALRKSGANHIYVASMTKTP